MCDRRLPLFIVSCVLAAGLGFAGRVWAVDYTFTKIADSAGSLGVMGDGPAINQAGEVAFQALTDAGGQGIYRGSGGELQTIAEGTSSFPGFTIRPSINDAGKVAYVRTESSSARVELSDGLNTTIIADSAGPSFASFIGWPRVNNSGLVAFAATRDGGGTGVFTAVGVAGFNTIVQSGFSGISPNYTMNNSGKVGFRGNAGGWAIFAAVGGAGGTTTIANAAGPYNAFAGNASINDDGWVVFRATLDGQTTDNFFKGAGGSAQLVASTSGLYSFLYIPAINASGLVAFRASLDSGQFGMFTGPDPVADKVILTGEKLDGSTVLALSSHNQAINDNGQIAFRVQLADGRFGVFRADPVRPCPADLNGSGAADVDDLLMVINSWGACPACAADTNADGLVDVDDLLTVINGWGACS